MAAAQEAEVDFEVTPKNLSTFWIAVGDDDVRLRSGKGSINLPRPGTYILTWHMEGMAGASMNIVGKIGPVTVVEVKETKIPDGEESGAGIRRFSI